MSLKIVFMGTPEFAVHALKAIISTKHKVTRIVTTTDKPAGRGKQIKTSAVKQFALDKGIPLLQPNNLKDTAFIRELEKLQADVFVVVAFRMLPKVVWSIPPKGTFNLHASLLPNFRGAAPINWAIIKQEKNTGVTSFLIDEQIDTGNILCSSSIKTHPRETAGTLHDKLANLGGEVIVLTLNGLEKNQLKPKPQKLLGTEYSAPKLTKENTRIDWKKSGEEIDAFIRGLSPYPAAWTELISQTTIITIKIYEAEFVKLKHSHIPGRLIIEQKSLQIALTDGLLNIIELQLPNKKRLKTADLLNGYRFEPSSSVK